MSPESPHALDTPGVWKAWVLLLVAEASRLGQAPVAGPQLHVILYLANTLADLFDVTRVRGRVLKKGPLPFYPDVQWEIDRLAFSGVLKIERVDFQRAHRMTAHYGLGPRGHSIYKSLLDAGPEVQRTARLMRELVAASLGRFLVQRPAIGPIDANYGDLEVMDSEVVDFAEWTDDNKNMELARYLINQLRRLRPDTKRDGVRLYCEYLDKAMVAPA